MNQLIMFVCLLFFCLSLNAIDHFFITRLEKRIGLSHSIKKIMFLNLSSYSRSFIYILILYSASIIWKENPFVPISIVVVLKLLNKEYKYGSLIVELSALSAILLSISYTINIDNDIIKFISFIIYSTSVALFNKEGSSSISIRTANNMVLHMLGLQFYFKITDVYTLIVVSFCTLLFHNFCIYFIPQDNQFNKMRTRSILLLVSSILIIIISLVYDIIIQGQ